ncbi:MAG: ABC-F family ATP-binding cassette domain-containing protein [Anaerolineae bacterium]
MSIVMLEDIGKHYGAKEIFAGLRAPISRGDRIGLIGPNGAGKSTLLRIIAGQEEPTAGRATRARDLRIAYLPQLADWQIEQTLYDAMLEAFAELRAVQKRLRQIEEQLGRPDCRAELLEEYGALQARFESAGGFTFEAQIGAVLLGLGFAREDFGRPIFQLSGGQRTRALLARYLLEQPDLLLLDEPTNHLDLAGVEWLENYLQQWEGSFIIVAHDRRLLDRLVTRIWELSFGRLEIYDGNYSRYIVQRAERLARRQTEFQAQQELIARTEAFVQRYKAGQRAREARGRLRRLERLERVNAPELRRRIHLPLHTELRSGDMVLQLRDLRVGFAGPPRVELLRCPDVVVQRGERVAILGPNGAGKTTLMRTIVGEHPPLAGTVLIGANVRIGYLAQAHAGLNPEHTLLEELLSTADITIQQARDLLGQMLFSGEEVYQRIGQLSGGERSRVALAKLMLAGANLLVLDEPTNHLDLEAQEQLEKALEHFPGTLLLVTHDRALVDHLAMQVWVIQDNVLHVFRGTYSEYLASRQALQTPRPSAGTGPAPRQRQEEREAQRRAQRRQQLEVRRRQERVHILETEAQALEEQLRLLEQRLESASLAGQVEELHRLGQEYQRLKARLDQVLEEWAELA